jgi:hypothetical protein
MDFEVLTLFYVGIWSQIWLSSELIAASTLTGKVFVIEAGVLRQVIDCCPPNMAR